MFGHERYKIPVAEYVTPNPICIHPDATVLEAEKILVENDIRHLPVVDKRKPIGIISSRDLKVLKKHIDSSELKAIDIMTPGPHTLSLSTPLEKAAFDLSNYKIGSALIVDEKDEITGIFTTTDALNALIEVIRAEVEE